MPTKEMTFWDHLDVLRNALFRTLGVLVALAVALFIIMPTVFDTYILGPCFGDFIAYRWFCALGNYITLPSSFCDKTFAINLINIELTSQFMVHLKVSFLLAVLLAVPYLLFEVWRFIRPALYEQERLRVGGAFVLGSGLFYLGVAISYWLIFPLTLRFLDSYRISAHVENRLSLDAYMNTFIGLNLVFGLVFEMPLLALFLSKLGLIDRSFFRKWRRHAIVLLVLVAALITPTGDPFTLALVSLPLYLLYELSGALVKKEETLD